MTGHQDVSQCNPDGRSSSSDTILKGDKRTGKTFAGVMVYIRSRRPQLVGLENVPPLDDTNPVKPSNCDQVVATLEVAGYDVWVGIMSPEDHGIPQRRKRLWFLGVLRGGIFRRGPGSVHEWRTSVATILGAVAHQPCKIDDLLMTPTEIEVWHKMQSRFTKRDDGHTEEEEQEEEAASPTAKKQKKDEQWPELHRTLFRSHGLRHPPVLEVEYPNSKVAVMMKFCPRVRECIYFKDP